MSRVLVTGVGKMGRVICYAMNKLGHDVVGLEGSQLCITLAKKVTPESVGYIHTDDLHGDLEEIVSDYDVVISALPYHQTEKVGKICIDAKVAYCDLGGRVDVSANINSYADAMDFPYVFTDLGLAPGLANILGEEGVRYLGGATDLQMMVGGLPADRDCNPFGYQTTWSIDGLINEYKDDCEVVEDGKLKIVRGMDGLEPVYSKYLGEMEAFYTSGGASHSIRTMLDKGLTNCCYKTLRYLGHGGLVKFLMRDCNLDDDTMANIFSNGCGMTREDLVIVKVDAYRGSLHWGKEFIVPSDDNFTAMQKATAFSISAVAHQVANGLVSPTGKVFAYENVNFENLKATLLELGVRI
jgi:saccharopine dehydrogenase-like NADP-dependent oxidoreductase